MRNANRNKRRQTVRESYSNLPRPPGLFVPARILERTREFNLRVMPDSPLVELNAEQRRLQDMANLIQDGFGCHATNTRQLVELILEQELPSPTVEDTQGRTQPWPWIPGALVIYQGQPALIYLTDGDGDAYYYTGEVEQSSYITAHSTSVELATDDRVNEFLVKAGLLDIGGSDTNS
jgi:hypothetical protein